MENCKRGDPHCPKNGGIGKCHYDCDEIMVNADEFRRLQTIEKEALNLIKVKGRHNAEIAMNRLIYACHKNDDE